MSPNKTETDHVAKSFFNNLKETSKFSPLRNRSGSKNVKGAFGSNKRTKRILAIEKERLKRRKLYNENIRQIEKEQFIKNLVSSGKQLQELPLPTPITTTKPQQ